jgi:hypothetical protein
MVMRSGKSNSMKRMKLYLIQRSAESTMRTLVYPSEFAVSNPVSRFTKKSRSISVTTLAQFSLSLVDGNPVAGAGAMDVGTVETKAKRWKMFG